MTIEIKEIWGNQISSLCKEYNAAALASDIENCKDIVRRLLTFLRLKNWRLSLRAAQAIEKIAKANPTIISDFSETIISDYQNGLYPDKDARETVIIALRWCFPYIDPMAKTSEIILLIKSNQLTGK